MDPFAFGIASANRGSEDRAHSQDGATSSSSEDSYFGHSDADSEDSQTRRRREAEERLTDLEEAGPGPSATLLPSPLDVLGQVSGAPAFLTPEATRPLAAPIHRNQVAARQKAQEAAAAAQEAAQGAPGAAQPWDVASMAPPLKGGGEAEKRGLPSGAIISAAAKRYRPDDDGDTGVVTAAQVAMLGGQWRPSGEAEALDGGAKGKPQKGPSRPMGVADFLAKGQGGAQLPRARQERREREKEKRARGQSSIHGWKSEAEMVLRQQYD